MHLRVILGMGLALLHTSCVWAACQPAPIGTATVSAAVDGRTLRLADGREIRLAGIETPQGDSAKNALEKMAAGRGVSLFRMGPDTDRYGRTVAWVIPDGGVPKSSAPTSSLQEALLALGQARVAANIGQFACSSVLFAAERAARAAGLGLWADPYYVVRQAEDPAGILAVRGRFAVIEGKILSVRESGATIYVNFGRKFTEDFTVTVAKRNERIFTDAGMTLKTLAGQRVRVRGTVEERGGPWIEAARPEQIEIAERE